LRSLPAVAGKDSVAILMPWLGKTSYNDTLRVAAITGLGNAKDLGALDALLTWTQRGKSRPARLAALTAVVKLAQSTAPTGAQRAAILDAIAACATGEGEMPIIRRSAIT